MIFLKLNEIYGGEVLININHVWQITPETGGNAMLWYSNIDSDTLRVKESFQDVELMIHFAKKADGVMDQERLHQLMNQPAHSIF